MKSVKDWLAEARRYAEHRYCYGAMLDDFPNDALDSFECGDSPYEWVERVGAKYDLDRADTDWGINSGLKFERRA